MRDRNRVVVAYAAFALLAAGAAWAGVDHEGYPAISKNTAAPTESITGATVADSTTATTAIASRAKESAGNTSVCVQVDFSGAAGDTCVVSLLPYHISAAGTVTLLPGLQTQTATAGSFVDSAGDNIAPALFFELSSGCTHYEIRHAAPSAGNVDLTWVAYSADPK